MSLTTLLLVGVAVGVAVGCTRDEDCNLNGVCSSGKCACDTPWTGDNCGFLSFLPAKTSPCGKACVYHGQDGTSTSWGGSVVLADDKKYYMAVAEMAFNCSLNTWTSNSQVAIAVADTPTGPFSKVSVAIQPWAHNPEMVRYVDGTYLIYTLGNGTAHGHQQHCDGSQPTEEEKQRRHKDSNRTVGFVIHASKSLQGPWEPHVVEIPNFEPSWNMDNWNPAPVVMPDGRIRVMVHTDPAPWAGETIVEAQHWTGPYLPITGDVTPCEKCQEDPFMWVDKRGNWHALYHRMFDPPGSSPVPSPGWSGGHVYSRDGLTWSNFSNYEPMSRCYNTSIVMDTGEVYEVNRRERPKLLFDPETKTPKYLYNGVITKDNGIYTVVVPLG